MRFFLRIRVLLSVCILFIFSNSWGYENLSLQDKELFYSVSIPVNKEENTSSKQFKKLLVLGMKSLLIRLTGISKPFNDPSYNSFFIKPSRWLKTYSYQKELYDDEELFKNLILQFDRKRILQQIQKQKLNIWPLESRPNLLVVGDYIEDSHRVHLTEDTLVTYKIFDYNSIGKHWGFYLHNLETHTHDLSTLESIAKKRMAEGIINFQFKKNLGSYSLKANLYDLKKEKWQSYTFNVSENTVSTETIKKDLYQKMFSKVTENFSKNYYAKGYKIHAKTFVIEGITTIQQVLRVETKFRSMKPTIHKIELQELKNSKAKFKIIHQGSDKQMQDRLNKIHNLRILD